MALYLGFFQGLSVFVKGRPVKILKFCLKYVIIVYFEWSSISRNFLSL